MNYSNILIVTDNHFLFRNFKSLVADLGLDISAFTFRCTASDMQLSDEGLQQLNVKKQYTSLLNAYDLVFSLHCKQIFPAALVNNVRCINVHPGLNPHNRGWYPQVFSILNGKPIGATIHEMDEQIDHGAILAQKQVKIDGWDTSLDVYNKVVQAELELLRENLIPILNGTLTGKAMLDEGNYNGIDDFNRLLELDLNEPSTIGGVITKLRALTHGSFKNAYFLDKETGRKIFVRLNLDADA